MSVPSFSEALLAQTGTGTIYNDGKVHIYFGVHDQTRDGKETPLVTIYAHYDLPLCTLNDQAGGTPVTVKDEDGKSGIKYMCETGNRHGIGPWLTCREIVTPHLPEKIVEFCDDLAPTIDRLVSELRKGE